jgi:hypothetical protein
VFALFGGAGTTFGKCSALVLGCPAYDQAVRDRLVAGEVVDLLDGDAEVRTKVVEFCCVLFWNFNQFRHQ